MRLKLKSNHLRTLRVQLRCRGVLPKELAQVRKAFMERLKTLLKGELLEISKQPGKKLSGKVVSPKGTR